MEKLSIYLVMWLASLAPLFFYAAERCRRKFRLRAFFAGNTNRFFLGAAGSLLFGTLLILVPREDLQPVFGAFGLALRDESSLVGLAVALGLGLGALLVVGTRSEKRKRDEDGA